MHESDPRTSIFTLPIFKWDRIDIVPIVEIMRHYFVDLAIGHLLIGGSKDMSELLFLVGH